MVRFSCRKRGALSLRFLGGRLREVRLCLEVLVCITVSLCKLVATTFPYCLNFDTVCCSLPQYFESDDKQLYRSKIKYIEETDPEDLGLVFAEEEYDVQGRLEKVG